MSDEEKQDRETNYRALASAWPLYMRACHRVEDAFQFWINYRALASAWSLYMRACHRVEDAFQWQLRSCVSVKKDYQEAQAHWHQKMVVRRWVFWELRDRLFKPEDKVTWGCLDYEAVDD